MSMMKDGKDVNDVLDMPYNFVVELYKEETKPKETSSLIAAFGG